MEFIEGASSETLALSSRIGATPGITNDTGFGVWTNLVPPKMNVQLNQERDCHVSADVQKDSHEQLEQMSPDRW